MKLHLSQNDYYSEGESVVGEWWGKGAKRLGLEGLKVTEKHFQALRDNQHPFTGEKLTPRSRLIAFHDVVVSAPKSYSIMAQVGQDQRLVKAFEEASKLTFQELERFAAVRVRRGRYANTEAYRFTGNAAAAVYHHDTSRLLDPQHHHHLVFANLSYDEKTNRWLALQRRPMMEASKASVRQFFHRELARLTTELGYEVEWTKNGFRLKDISLELERKFSTRAMQRVAFEKRYQKLFGQEASKSRIEAFIKEGKRAAIKRFQGEFEKAFGRKPSFSETDAFVQDWRSAKMRHSSRTKVRQLQQDKLTISEKEQLQQILNKAQSRSCEIETEHERFEENQTLKEEHKVDDSAEIHGQRSTPEQKLPLAAPVRKTKSQRFTPQQLAGQRIEVLRRYRRGMAVLSALRGYPGVFMARQLAQMAYQRNQRR